MGLFSFLRRPRQTEAKLPVVVELPPPGTDAPTLPAVDPSQVRTLMFNAAAAGDSEKLANLCRQYHKLVVQHGPAWMNVPEEYRTSPALEEWYRSGLAAIAQFCEQKADPDAEKHDTDEAREEPPGEIRQ